jgi:hypothetical protein
MSSAVQNPFDHASRGLVRRAGLLMLAWLLRVAASSIRFERWLDTRLSLPNQPDRVCDTIAHVWREDEGGFPWAVPIEFQAAPDPLMFGRAMGYQSMTWLQEKPTPHPGDRFNLVCVIVNLTGVGDCGRRMTWRTQQKAAPPKAEGEPEQPAQDQAEVPPQPELAELPIEWNLETLDAFEIMDGIAKGELPRALLAWVSLMKNGDHPDILKRWPELAELEKDPVRRADLKLVVVFADLTGRAPLWKQAVEGFNVIESPTVKEWTASARAEGEAKGKIGDLVRILEKKFQAVPPDLKAKIESATDLGVLENWVVTAAIADTLDRFRQDAGI